MFDNDSRLAAFRRYGKKQLGWLFNTSTFTGNLVIALISTYFFRQLNYGDAVDYVLFLALLSIGLWITEAIPPFAVGIFIIAMLLLGFGTDYIIDDASNIDMYVDTWTSSVIWLLLGGFFLAEGMRIAQLDKTLFSFTINRFGSNPKRLLFGFMLTTAIGSMVMSNTATTAMMITSVLPLIRILGKNHSLSKGLLIGIPAAASVGGIGTIIGSTPNAIAVGALQEAGLHLSFLDWMIFGVPIALVLVYTFYRYLAKSIEGNFDNDTINWKELTQTDKLNSKNRNAVLFTLALTILLWLTEGIHGIPVAATSAVPIVLLTLTQVVNAQHVRNLPWETLMLVAGGLALGLAIVDVGLAKIVMDKVTELPVLPFGISLIFAFVAVLLSNVMSNTAASAILVPLGLSLSGIFGIATPLIIAISCSCALMLPVSTPSNAISYATGLIEQKSFRKGGVFFIFLGPVIAFAFTMTWAYLKTYFST
jgi:solute carrier family 13 (sodium-dependent dicarboxylate transporter), member 2/3/5